MWKYTLIAINKTTDQVIGHFGGLDLHDIKNPKENPSKNKRYHA